MGEILYYVQDHLGQGCFGITVERAPPPKLTVNTPQPKTRKEKLKHVPVTTTTVTGSIDILVSDPPSFLVENPRKAISRMLHEMVDLKLPEKYINVNFTNKSRFKENFEETGKGKLKDMIDKSKRGATGQKDVRFTKDAWGRSIVTVVNK